MGKQNKANRARRKRERDKARRRPTQRDEGYGRPDPDSGGRFLKQPGIKYANEPDIAVKCRTCQHVRYVPVSATVLGPETGGLDRYSLEEYNLVCLECGDSTTVEPRVEVLEDGTTLFWTDRSVLEDYEGEEVVEYVFRDRRTGAKFAFTQGDPDFEFWALCDDCRMPFRATGAFAVTYLATEDTGGHESKAGPCTHCGGLGTAVVTRMEHEGLITYANSPGFAESVAWTIADEIASGKIDLTTAIRELRESRDPNLGRIANWIESRPVSAMMASTVLSVAAGIIGPQLASQPPKVNAPPAGDRYSDEQVEKIIETILDHYDEQLQRETADRHDRPTGNTAENAPKHRR